MAVYGLHIMTPISWEWAGMIWAYCLVWALITDPIKVLAYRIFDRKSDAPKHETPVGRTPAAVPAVS
jgi:H+-transporting ATPase